MLAIKPIFKSIIFLFSITLVASCTKNISIGDKPVIEFVNSPLYLSQDTTLPPDTKFQFQVKTSRAEDLSTNVSFEVVRKYSNGLDTSVYYQSLEGDDQKNFVYTHTFTTLKRAGEERFTVVVKNKFGITNYRSLNFIVR